jgi:hypothetical protein
MQNPDSDNEIDTESDTDAPASPGFFLSAARVIRGILSVANPQMAPAYAEPANNAPRVYQAVPIAPLPPVVPVLPPLIAPQFNDGAYDKLSPSHPSNLDDWRDSSAKKPHTYR